MDTKLRRVLRMHEAGALAGLRVIVLGDDDLISLAIAAFAALPAAAAWPRRLAVVDCDPDLLGYLGARAAAACVSVELIDHDLRQPLPAGLARAFDVACTDPPYTVAGAELFLSRAVSALAAGPGSHVFFSFGARRPEETLRVERLIVKLGWTWCARLCPASTPTSVRASWPRVSHLYHLRTTAQARPAIPPGPTPVRCTRPTRGPPPPGPTAAPAAGPCIRSARAPAGALSPG